MGHTMTPCSCIIHPALAPVRVCLCEWVSVYCEVLWKRESNRERRLLIGGSMGVADWCVSVTDWYIICSSTQNIQRFWAHKQAELHREACGRQSWAVARGIKSQRKSDHTESITPCWFCCFFLFLRCLVIWLHGFIWAWIYFILDVLLGPEHQQQQIQIDCFGQTHFLDRWNWLI